MFRFVTIIPLSFWAIVLLMLFTWAAFGVGGLVITVLGLAVGNWSKQGPLTERPPAQQRRAQRDILPRKPSTLLWLAGGISKWPDFRRFPTRPTPRCSTSAKLASSNTTAFSHPSGSSGASKTFVNFTRYVERFDEGKGRFLEKCQKQLAGADDDIFQVAQSARISDAYRGSPSS
jgi:hypothetical protein